MPKVATPLTNTKIQSAKSRDKDYMIADGKGLRIRIRKNGTKDWIFLFQLPFTNKGADVCFGLYPTVSLAEARERRARTLEPPMDH